jgi:dGTP triphosphohydrolase
MALDGPTATIIAALIAATVVFISLGWNVLYRLGKLEKGAENTEKALEKNAADTEKALEKNAADTEKALEKNAADTEKALEKNAADTEKALEKSAVETEKRFDRLEETMRAEHEATRAEIRRLAEALASHTHDSDGTTIFRIPPG